MLQIYLVLVCIGSVVAADTDLDFSGASYTVEWPANIQLQRSSAYATSNDKNLVAFPDAPSIVITPVVVTKRRLGKQRKAKGKPTPLGKTCVGGPSAWTMAMVCFAFQFVGTCTFLWGTTKARPNASENKKFHLCCFGEREVGAVGGAAAFCIPFLYFWSGTGLLMVIVKLASSCTYRDDKDNYQYRHWYILLVIVANLCLCILYVPLMKVMDKFSLNVFGIERACAQLHGAMVKTVKTSHPQPQVVGTNKIIVVTMHITPHGSKLDLKFTTMSGDEVLGITYDKAVDNVNIIWPALAEALGEPMCSIRLVSADGALMHDNGLLRKLLADETTIAV